MVKNQGKNTLHNKHKVYKPGWGSKIKEAKVKNEKCLSLGRKMRNISEDGNISHAHGSVE